MTTIEQVDIRPVPARSRASAAGATFVVGLLLVLCTGGLLANAAETSAPASPTDAKASDHRQEHRLPSFQGRTLDGKSLSSVSFSGKRLILLCFNPGIEQATAYAQALANVAAERSRYNFQIAAVAMGLDPANARAFVARLGLDFPVFDDSDAYIAQRLGLQSPLALLGIDGEGRVGLARIGFEHEPAIPAAAIEASVREYLRLPRVGAVANGELDQRPKAPPFEAERVGGGDRLRLSDLSGKPVVLAFFLPTCPHCRDALRFFKSELARIPEKIRPMLVGVSIDSRAYAVQATLENEKLDFFPVLNDPEREIAAAYGAFAGVPDILLIDAGGRIFYRGLGWAEQRDPKLMRMRLALLTGTEVPMLLERDGFSGSDACAVCHPTQTATWMFTDHSIAFDSLVTRAADHDPKCVSCHVVGFGERGGYSEAARQEYLENVGCESCHGPSGGHLAARSKPAAAAGPTDYRLACKRCHDAEHSLGFEYESFLPKISHAAIAALGDADREKLVTGRGKPRDLLPANSAIAGSSTCKRCHEREYAVWSRSAHARSVESLRKERKETRAECLRCHVTGYGRPGGFPDGGRVSSDEDLARVGCESCHGPGAEHVKGDGKHLGNIVKLGDKCDSCVILQICGGCHDDANDPGFRFDVTRKIDAQRHGPAREEPARTPKEK
ncbi:MAG: redoxin domain-containing protein [Deltaproteobacteria bacterium]|nr:redoxin domain-containing protein [Deltaproteobacteria bacterium]